MTAPQKAPKIQFSGTSALEGTLQDFAGQYVVLYFYPKDATPGCTQESQDFTALHAAFVKKNAVVLGVSKDDLASHEKFKAKHNMPFELIADTEGALCDAFDVIKEKNMYGKKYMGIERSTFLIDPNGHIIESWRKVKVKDHAQTVLACLP